MHTSFLLLALWTAGADSRAATTTWTSDYRDACRLVDAHNRPLVILFAHGKDGWDRVVSGDGSDPSVQQLLASDYVCASIDTSTEQGQRLASRFELPDGTGVVISDRAGEKQAFWHAGRISADDLAEKLRKYADPEVKVDRTEKLAQATTLTTSSYTPALAPAAAPAYAPALAPQAPMLFQASSFAPSFAPAVGGGC